jgi:hypothetical protein
MPIFIKYCACQLSELWPLTSSYMYINLGYWTIWCIRFNSFSLCCYFGFSVVSSAKPDNIFWIKFEETWLSWLMLTTFLQIFPIWVWASYGTWSLWNVILKGDTPKRGQGKQIKLGYPNIFWCKLTQIFARRRRLTVTILVLKISWFSGGSTGWWGSRHRRVPLRWSTHYCHVWV